MCRTSQHPSTPSLHGLSDGDCSSAATSTFSFFLKNVIPVTLISCRWWNLYSSPFEMEVDWCHNKNYFNCFLPGLSHTPLRFFSGACFSPWGSLCEPWVGKTIMKLFPGPQIVTGLILLSPSIKVPLFLFCFVSFPFSVIQGISSGARRDSRNQIPQKGSGENHASGGPRLHPLGWAIGYVCLSSWQINEPFSWFVMSAFIGQGRRHWSIWSNSWSSLFTVLSMVRTLVEWNSVCNRRESGPLKKQKSPEFFFWYFLVVQTAYLSRLVDVLVKND